jgi:DNA-binding LacI/PurR family transcriptional regulator
MAKYESICELMEKRIRLGDYAMKEIPAEERLALEVGVSRMTARRAVMRLVERGILVRKPNGRVVVNRQSLEADAQPQVALLMPAFVSLTFERWLISAEVAASKLNMRVRKVDYVHWDDPTIAETFENFDGVFLVPSSEEVPPQVIQRFRLQTTPLVVLDSDWTADGLRSIDLAPPRQMRRLLDHLWDLGHRKIACLNTQPHSSAVIARLKERADWEAERGVSGRLIDDPVQPRGDTTVQAYEVMSKFLQARRPDFTAIVATTVTPAIGAMRALYEAGIKVGKDLSLCAVNDEGLAKYMCPSLTCTQMPDPEPFLAVGYEWMTGRGGWDKSQLLLQPADVSLFKGESTGPCREESAPRSA